MRGGMTNVSTNQALSDGVNTLSNLRPDVQGISNRLIHIAKVNISGGPGYHAAREILFRQILGPALRHNIQHFCVRELGTRSGAYLGSALLGGSEAQTLVR
jgi:hypothetical protein